MVFTDVQPGMSVNAVCVSYDSRMQFNEAAAAYIVRYHTRFMTEVEHRVGNHLVATIKARGRDDTAAQGKARISRFYSQYISDDPDVLRLARGGYRAFHLWPAQRIFEELGKEDADLLEYASP